MMNLRNAMVIALFMLLFLVVTVKVVSGSFLGMLLMGGLVAFFTFNLLLSFRKYWLILALGLWLLPWALPLPILSRFTIGLVFGLFLFVIQAVDTAMQHQVRVALPFWPVDWLILLVAMAITARFIWDHPGSARMGETGGLGEAILFFIGIWLYFMLRRQAATCEFNRPQRILLLIIAVVAFLWPFVSWAIQRGIFYRGVVFYSSMWLIGPLIITQTLYRYGGKVNWRIVLLGMCYLALSVVPPHRSRIAFALCSLFTVGWIYRHAQKTIVFLIGIVTALALWIVVSGYENLPELVQRPLSTLAQLLGRTQGVHQEGEYGISSDFRATMYRYGWEQIKQHPLTGKGVSLSREELIAQLTSSDYMFGTLALAGGYHNAYFQLAVQYGVPVMLLFSLATLLILFSFFKWGRYRTNANGRMWAALISGFFVCIIGHALINGGGNTFYIVCLLLGTMQGMMQNPLLGISAVAPKKAEQLSTSPEVKSFSSLLLAEHK